MRGNETTESESVECATLRKKMKVYKSFSDTLSSTKKSVSGGDPVSDRVFMLNGV